MLKEPVNLASCHFGNYQSLLKNAIAALVRRSRCQGTDDRKKSKEHHAYRDNESRPQGHLAQQRQWSRGDPLHRPLLSPSQYRPS